MTRMTKADRIRAMAANGLRDDEIAARVGTSRNYVRVYARQRVGGTSDNDRRYAQSALGKANARRKYQRMRCHADKELANIAWRSVYGALQASGLDRVLAKHVADLARQKIMWATARRRGASGAERSNVNHQDTQHNG